eukprot:Skav230947  [mRNA]  locus=scaffold3010:39159:43861:- [translate_table: standard]
MTGLDFTQWPAPTPAVQVGVDMVEVVSQNEDHRSCSLQCVAEMASHTCLKAPSSRVPFDRMTLQDSWGSAHAKTALQTFLHEHGPDLWHQSPEQSAVFLNEHVSNYLQATCPKPRSKPKPGWIRQVTYDMLHHSRRCRRHAADIRKRLRAGQIRHALATWRGRTRSRTGPPRITCPEAHPRWFFTMWRAEAHMLHLASTMRQHVRRALRQDEAAYLRSCVREVNDHMQDTTSSNLWRRLRTQLPKWRKRFQNRPLKFEVTHQAFLEHFARIEDAIIRPMPEVLQTTLDINHQSCEAALHVCTDIEDVPTICELEQAIRGLQTGRAVAGTLMPEILKADPATAAQILYPSLCNMAIFYQQPHTWKGGFLHPLQKKAGSDLSVRNHRAILIADAVPRLFSRIARSRLACQVTPHMHPLQIGGLAHMSVQFGSMILNALRQNARAHKVSHAVLFVDLQAAFYRTQRSTVVDNILGLSARGHDEDVAIQTLPEQDALSAMHVRPALRAWIQALMEGTWSQVSGSPLQLQDRAMLSVRGTRPGDPSADLTFSTLMARVLRQVVQDADDMLPSIVLHGSDHQVGPLAWVDDVCIFLQDADPMALLQKAARITSIMHARVRQMGLDVNYAPGKTEILVRLEGRGSQRASQYLQEHQLSVGDGLERIPVITTSTYVHLGQRQTSSMKIGAEIDRRVAMAQEALAEARRVLSHKQLALTPRFMLAESLILSRLFFGADTWLDVPAADFNRLQAFLTKLHRVVLNQTSRKDKHAVTDVRLRTLHAFPDADAYLRVARIRLLHRMLVHGPPLLQAMLTDPCFPGLQSYRQLIHADIEWFARHLKHASWPPSLLAWHELIAFVSSPEFPWKAWCRRVLRAAGRALQSDAIDHDVYVGASVASSVALTLGDFACRSCSKTFATACARAVHERQAHGTATLARQYMPDPTVCQQCLLDFRTTQRLRQHLQYRANGCWDNLLRIHMPMTEREVLHVQTVRQKSTSYRLLPVRLYGPVLPTAEQWLIACPWRRSLPAPVEGLPPYDPAEWIIDWLINELPWDRPSDWTLPTCVPADGDLSWWESLRPILDSLEAWIPNLSPETHAHFMQWIQREEHRAKGVPVMVQNPSAFRRRVLVCPATDEQWNTYEQCFGVISGRYDSTVVCVRGPSVSGDPLVRAHPDSFWTSLIADETLCGLLVLPQLCSSTGLTNSGHSFGAPSHFERMWNSRVWATCARAAMMAHEVGLHWAIAMKTSAGAMYGSLAERLPAPIPFSLMHITPSVSGAIATDDAAFGPCAQVCCTLAGLDDPVHDICFEIGIVDAFFQKTFSAR